MGNCCQVVFFSKSASHLRLGNYRKYTDVVARLKLTAACTRLAEKKEDLESWHVKKSWLVVSSIVGVLKNAI